MHILKRVKGTTIDVKASRKANILKNATNGMNAAQRPIKPSAARQQRQVIAPPRPPINPPARAGAPALKKKNHISTILFISLCMRMCIRTLTDRTYFHCTVDSNLKDTDEQKLYHIRTITMKREKKRRRTFLFFLIFFKKKVNIFY